MKDCKIIVNSEVESTIAQLCSIKEGAKWASSKKRVIDITVHGYSYPMFLFVKKNEITYEPNSSYGKEYFINHSGEWLMLNELLKELDKEEKNE